MPGRIRLITERVLAGALLVLLGPILLLIMVAIWVDDSGPVFFAQSRVGFQGREFLILKFRSMREDPALESGFNPGDIRRVTRVGCLLRNWKLDELPQLINVLKGEMSFIGPRPEVRRWVDEYPDIWAEILAVRPGITDPAAIEFRNEEDLLRRSEDPNAYYRDVILPRKLSIYRQYLANRSLKSDLIVILRTFSSVLNR